jgi:argininosuccinate lyase
MAGLSMSIKGLPSTYDKDLQESTEPMIDHVKTVKDSLMIAARVLATLTVHPKKMLAAVTPDTLATDLAEYLVRKGKRSLPNFFTMTNNPGVPFRESHHIAGRVVRHSEETGISMDKLTLQDLQGIDSRFGGDAQEIFDPEKSVEMKSAIGGTSRKAVLDQIVYLLQVMSAGDPQDAKLTATTHGLELLEAKMASE